jgi:hypothetical protein
MEPNRRNIGALQGMVNQVLPPKAKKEVNSMLGAVKALSPESRRTARALLGVGIALTVVAVAAAVALAVFATMGLAFIPAVAIAVYTAVAVVGTAGLAMTIAGAVLLHREVQAKKKLTKIGQDGGQELLKALLDREQADPKDAKKYAKFNPLS